MTVTSFLCVINVINIDSHVISINYSNTDKILYHTNMITFRSHDNFGKFKVPMT